MSPRQLEKASRIARLAVGNPIAVIRYLRSNLRLKIFGIKNKKAANTIRRVIHQGLTYKTLDGLCDLAQVAIENEKRGLDGTVIEAGCALGGSAITLASAKNKNRMFFVYDIFSMIPPPSERDEPDVHELYKVITSGKRPGIRGDLYYGYQENLYDKVLKSFADLGFEVQENNVHFVKGLFEDALKVTSPVSLAHIDCDWYDSVLTCLNQIEPHLVKGGTLVIDDYFYFSGCRAAVHKYFDNRPGFEFIKKTVLHIIKI